MKKLLSRFLLLCILIASMSYSASAQIYVKVRPNAPSILRTPQPSHTHVWIRDDWEPNGNEYRYTGSRWDTPPHAGDKWEKGHWKQHKPEGHTWVHGNWRSRK